MASQSFAPMVEISRGGLIESDHRGAVAVVDSSGRLVASLGNPREPILLRSSAKPFQALALVCSGAAQAYGLTDEELAVVCSSHGGDERQVELVESILQKAGLDESMLRCGIHAPMDPAVRRSLAREGREPGPLHNNCSGKHAGMLATARHLGLTLHDYIEPDHGVQQAILGLLAFLAGMEADQIQTARGGCSAPTACLPLRSMALAMARLAAAGEGLLRPDPGNMDPSLLVPDEEVAEFYDDPPDEPPDQGREFEDELPVPLEEGLATLWRAMRGHPMLIAGAQGRIDTDIMRSCGQVGIPLVAKAGAEGVYTMAMALEDEAYGIALKIEDGAERARNAAAVQVLVTLDLIPDEAAQALAGYHRPVILNCRGDVVGSVVPVFQLNLGIPG